MEISEREQNVYNVLEKLGIEYKLYRHEPICTIAAAEELDKKLEKRKLELLEVGEWLVGKWIVLS